MPRRPKRSLPSSSSCRGRRRRRRRHSRARSSTTTCGPNLVVGDGDGGGGSTFRRDFDDRGPWNYSIRRRRHVSGEMLRSRSHPTARARDIYIDILLYMNQRGPRRRIDGGGVKFGDAGIDRRQGMGRGGCAGGGWRSRFGRESTSFRDTRLPHFLKLYEFLREES